MKTISEHIEHVKGKPHHIRKQIAFTVAGCGTAVIALVWLVGGLSTGAFVIEATSFADSTKPAAIQTVSGGVDGPKNIAGAAAAIQDANAPAHIEIVDVASSTRPTKKAEQTTIPF